MTIAARLDHVAELLAPAVAPVPVITNVPDQLASGAAVIVTWRRTETDPYQTVHTLDVLVIVTAQQSAPAHQQLHTTTQAVLGALAAARGLGWPLAELETRTVGGGEYPCAVVTITASDDPVSS